MWCADNWRDYELLDTSDGERLERWGDYILIRPDPQVIWRGCAASPLWKKANGIYRRSSTGGGSWVKNTMPAEWHIGYGDRLRFVLRPMGFKHTGLFPEQAANWDWFSALIRRAREAEPGRQVRVLNLFAYTGGATVAAAAAGAAVVHVDASKGMTAQAKENARLCGLSEAPIRYIVDDCSKFVEREIRRGNRYDGIIMDPPSYGRGPGGEVWEAGGLRERAGRAGRKTYVGQRAFLSAQYVYDRAVTHDHALYRRFEYQTPPWRAYRGGRTVPACPADRIAASVRRQCPLGSLTGRKGEQPDGEPETGKRRAFY